MGTSLADRAWSRESAVFRITGVLSVIGGWFITAGAAFVMCFFVTNILHFGSFLAMVMAIALALFMLIRSNIKYKPAADNSPSDALFRKLIRCQDKNESWTLLNEMVNKGRVEQLQFVGQCYETITGAFINEEYRPLKRSTHQIETARKQFKRARRREIIGLRKIDPILAMEKNTWFFLANSNVEQMLYSLKRINDPCREHVGNNFSPVSPDLTYEFRSMQSEVAAIIQQIITLVEHGQINEPLVEQLRNQARNLQNRFSNYRKKIIDAMQQQNTNIEAATVFLNILQESQQIISCLRHMLRGMLKFITKEE